MQSALVDQAVVPIEHQPPLGMQAPPVVPVKRRIMRTSSFQSMESTIQELTRAERDVLFLVLAGRTNAEIAIVRGRSKKTVANQISQILRKYGVSSRRELCATLRRHRACREELTLREREVLARAAAGKSNKVIACELGVTTSTIGVLISRAARKADESR